LALEQAPYVLAEASGDLLVLKEGRLFVCSRRDGDIYPGFVTGEGLYAADARHLSEFRVTIGGRTPILLSSSANRLFRAVIHASNPDLLDGDSLLVPQLTLNLHRDRLLAEWLYEHIDLRNNGREPVSTDLHLHVAADFADIFEVRGLRQRISRGEALVPELTERGVCFAYQGEDGVLRRTDVWAEPAPDDLVLRDHGASLRWQLQLEPGDGLSIDIAVGASTDGGAHRRQSFRAAAAAAHRSAQQWEDSCTTIQTDSRLFARLTRASIRDLRGLITPMDGDAIMAAGIPWFVAPFGRDSLLTCHAMLLLTQTPARDTLRFLSRHQALSDDAVRDAEPGKILHELRSGELARAGYVPHSPYYGSIDATPLFILLAAEYFRWTADLELMVELQRPLEAALDWIAHHGDQDGDGFIEYQRRSPGGLDNQGWKDSGDAIVHADGSLAKGPIALVEVQGYVYLAKVRIADVFDALDMPDTAECLRTEAKELKTRVNDAYWMPEEGTFALALDGAKRQVKSVTSNPGHCLYCEVIDADKAVSVAERLMAPDMFSGWGVRTLSQDSPAYNPMSYHNGSVWPHDNAIIAAGLKRYSFVEATEEIASALFEAAIDSSDSRLLELYCGFARSSDVPVVAYPVACKPQAWAAAAPFMLLQAMLGISPDASNGVLTVDQPLLPKWLRRAELSNLRIGRSRMSLAFTRRLGEATAISLLNREGDVQVTIRH
jgi:glycogen debranching enzyme